MIKMNRYWLMAAIGILLLVQAHASLAFDYNTINPFAGSRIDSPVQDVTTIEMIIVDVIRWVYTAFFIVAVLFILLAAFNFLQGGSNPKAIETAKSQLKWAVIAIVVALVASGLSWIIASFLAYGR